MKVVYLLTFFSILIFSFNGTDAMAQKSFEKDTIVTSEGPAEIWFIGHGTLMIAFDGRVIHVDPYSAVADYSALPGADIVLVTHEHSDHLDLKAIEKIRKEDTKFYCNLLSAPALPGATVMKNGDILMSGNMRIEAVPAYNVRHESSQGNPFHPKGEGNGYILTLGDKRIYIAGDTEPIPEMAEIKDIDIAFLPMNLPYTMTPEMVADAVRMFHPAILYPYHYGNTDPEQLLPLLAGSKTEVRIRDLK
ncbi:MAG: MBL fold metallo-hydrolase [Bacteroidales bacterium]|jgi:L-ascorbate metabolism protein UlaG (beta-lactamase superfamily)|nr:MBL fold metallo-hydrolase [Bacteroidales bacterium]